MIFITITLNVITIKMLNHNTKGEWKIQLSMTINFISSKDTNETRVMHSKTDNIEIRIGNKTHEIMQKVVDSLLQKYQKGLEESIKGCKFVFDSVNLLHYKFHKINLNRGESYIDFPKWLKSKKSAIKPKN